MNHMRARGELEYMKPALSHQNLLQRLSDRGLNIGSEERALRYLRHIGYYRLSPYAIPFQKRNTEHEFKADVSFDNLLDLYIFDRSLRLLVLDALERIEVSVRSAMSDYMSETYSDPHWYTSLKHFKNTAVHNSLIKIMRNACESQLKRKAESSKMELNYPSALEHYLTTYKTPELPPSWLMIETLTIGQLEMTYRNLKLRKDKTAIAKTLGLTAPVLESWLKSYVRVRNICAHHGRLWNAGLGAYPLIPTSFTIYWLQNQPIHESSRLRLYPVLVSLQSVLSVISPRSSWADRLYELVNERPTMNLRGMGFPEGWYEDSFWEEPLLQRDFR